MVTHSHTKRTTALLSLGNDLLGDDGIALVVARILKKDAAADVVFLESPTGGFALLDLLQGFDQAIILDAIMTGESPPGTVHEFAAEDLEMPPAPLSPHFAGIADCRVLADTLGISFPRIVAVFAIEVADPFTFSHDLSPSVGDAVPTIVRTIRDRLTACLATSQQEKD